MSRSQVDYEIKTKNQQHKIKIHEERNINITNTNQKRRIWLGFSQGNLCMNGEVIKSSDGTKIFRAGKKRRKWRIDVK